jgi:hypothetical protein
MLSHLLPLVASFLSPLVVHAAPWSLTTTLRTPGGTLQVDSDAPQTVVNAPVVTSHPQDTAVTVTVLPNAGYRVSSVVQNGVTLSSPAQTVFTVNGPAPQSVAAYFSVERFSITASVAGNQGGTANPGGVGGFTLNQVLASDLPITFMPAAATMKVSSISGIPPGALQAPANPVEGQPVVVTFPAGFVITGNILLVGTFSTLFPVAVAAFLAPAYAGRTVTLDASRSWPAGDISAVTWTQVSGPAAVTLLTPGAVSCGFVPPVAGTYAFSLGVMPGGSTVNLVVEVHANADAQVATQCMDCHVASGTVRTLNAYNQWRTSKHQANYLTCSGCHVGADSGGHPGLVPLDICMGCHATSQGTSAPISLGHMSITDTAMTTCHACHQHGLLPVVVSPTMACTTCHHFPAP